MSSIRTLGAAIAAAALFANPALAHHPSGGGTTGGAGAINTYSASTLGQGQVVAGIVLEVIKLDRLSDAQLIGAAANHVHAHSLDRILAPSLALAYGLTRDVTLSLRLPYVIRQDIREGHHHHHGGHAVNEVHERGDTSGIGDLTLMGQWRFLNSAGAGTELALLGGIKAPTGRTGEHDGDGELFEAEFQAGSGSWDFSIGGALSQRLAGPLSLHASAVYTIVTEGSQATDLGDRLHYGVALAYRVTGASGGSGPMYAGGPKGHRHSHPTGSKPHTHDEPQPSPGITVDLLLELNGEWAAEQKIAGASDANSGGHTLYLSPGVRIGFDRVSAFASVGIPVINELNGLQAEPDWRLVTGMAVSF